VTAYFSVFSARFRTLLQYRAAALAGCATQLFWGLIRVMIFTAFYRSTTAPQPMTLRDLISYLWLCQAMFALLPWNPDAEVRAMIRSGSVAYEMLRPLDLYAFWYSRAVAARLAPTLLRSGPLFLLAGLFFGLHAPPSPACAFAWAITTFGALFLAAAFSTLLTISMLWTVSAEGIARIVPTVVYALAGLLIPLPLFPGWMQPALNALPFRDMMDMPFRMYLGQIPPDHLGMSVLHQLVWLAAMVVCGRGLLARGARHLVVQGG
jgi:ABC-2 type transport system permease protein